MATSRSEPSKRSRLPRRAASGLANAEQAKENKREADRYATMLRPILIEFRHMPVEMIADELARRKVATLRGGRWHGGTVARLLDRLHLR